MTANIEMDGGSPQWLQTLEFLMYLGRHGSKALSLKRFSTVRLLITDEGLV